MQPEEAAMSIIQIDDRERASGICAHLAALHQAYCIQRLAVADYIVNQALYVERKTATDFMASLADQRLFAQVARLRADNQRVDGRIADRPWRPDCRARRVVARARRRPAPGGSDSFTAHAMTHAMVFTQHY